LISEYDSIIIILRYDRDGAPIQRERVTKKNSVGRNDESTFTESLVAKQIVEKSDGGGLT